MRRARSPLSVAWRLLALSACAVAHHAELLADSPSVQAQRPMNFQDVLAMRAVGNAAVSPDGRRMLYTLTVPDWNAARSPADLWLVELDRGWQSARQLTFTRDHSESSPRWSSTGRYFVFTSNRGSPVTAPSQNQLYSMRPDGGEANKLSDAAGGVDTFAFSPDGRWLAFSAGKDGQRQIWLLAAADPAAAPAIQLAPQLASIGSWQFSPDSQHLYLLAPQTVDATDRERIERGFSVRVRNDMRAPDVLWAVDLATRKERLLVASSEYSVEQVSLSKDSRWLGFRGVPNQRYQRFTTEAAQHADLYLLEIAGGRIERLTDNENIAESELEFSPDSSQIAFSAADDFKYAHNSRVYVREVNGGRWRKLGADFDGDVAIDFWPGEGKTLYFNAGKGATGQLYSLAAESGRVTQLTGVQGVVNATYHDDSKTLLLSYTDPTSPLDIYAAALDQVSDRAAWRRLTDSNPQVRDIALGETQTVSWRSSDGHIVEGVLTKPVGYRQAQRYPLIVQIHGGPAAASTLAFAASHINYPHVFAGAGYAVLSPNYRGSTQYGEKFKLRIVGDYFSQSYQDIIAGVDSLIARGLVDGERLGSMGWSSGGTFSNWILTHTTRFKAVSSGAGVANWLSMYAQTDLQGTREFYHRGMAYDHFQHYWGTSPIKYIGNARTPTLIHAVDGDPRVPRPQGEELHLGLRKLGVPTEFLVYPGSTHNIADLRNQMVKMVAEFNWFEHWIRGKPGWLDWRDLLATLPGGEPRAASAETADRAQRPQ